MLFCGMYEANVTPSLGGQIPGYFSPRLATGIKDELYAKAAYIENENCSVIIVAVDACSLSNSITWKIRNRISEASGVDGQNIMVSCTHTHTGGPVEAWGNLLKQDEAYVQLLIAKCTDAAVVAMQSKKRARLGFGNGIEEDIAFHRRYVMKDGSIKTNPGIGNVEVVKPAGPIDHEVSVLSIDDENGHPIGIISNYACHPDTIGGTEYSADYPGEMSNVIKRQLGENVVSLFIMGSSGNINHVDVMGRVFKSNNMYQQGHYKHMGRILASEVLKVREKNSSCNGNCSIKAVSRNLKLTTRQPGIEDVEAANKVLETVEEDISALNRFDAAQIDRFYALEAIRMYNDPGKDTPVDAEVQVIAIGDMIIAGIPGEIFVEFGLDIKKRSAFKNIMISSLSNDSIGYILTEEALNAGGYEGRLCSSSRLTADGGYKIADTVVDIISGMF